ncbi:hypothetical protein [Streptomyces capillispiralis]|uniref:Uncharacterized protein n=1 Tax=Streptomyces capillispiralis TaxID=68182 RepID=A0A561TGC6_9ACTN|nr:hypothetical protein [Streptomyces capillispiralis]TWF86150.1 hypothetical protein FHX78_113113 [Streptomyces capillispiralis]GHH91072.1 hypothetical protein GCM10017779_15290 [Streptomyces capillispiralis]
MESGPAIFAGTVFCLFGAGLLAWTVTRARGHRPVAQGVSPVASATVAGLVAVISLALGAWCFTRL